LLKNVNKYVSDDMNNGSVNNHLSGPKNLTTTEKQQQQQQKSTPHKLFIQSNS